MRSSFSPVKTFGGLRRISLVDMSSSGSAFGGVRRVLVVSFFGGVVAVVVTGVLLCCSGRICSSSPEWNSSSLWCSDLSDPDDDGALNVVSAFLRGCTIQSSLIAVGAQLTGPLSH